MKTYTDSNGKKWTTRVLSIYDNKIAPNSKFEFYSSDEIREHIGNGFEYASYSVSYDNFMKAYCVALSDYNEFIGCFSIL